MYRYAHIGNLRTYLFGDLLRRTLEYLGYEVTYVKNVTDVGHMRDDQTDSGEDRMVLAALEEGKSRPRSPSSIPMPGWPTRRSSTSGHRTSCPGRPTTSPRWQALIETLLDKGLAYRVDGTVYYDVSAFPAYGRLSGQRGVHPAWHPGRGRDRQARSRRLRPVEGGRAGASHALALTVGRGFPGWHIECSAMGMKYLGERFDIHTGGIDLKFPHHEDEIAQSDGALGHQVISLWMHGEFLTLADAKMAKSAGNIIRVSELPEKDSSRSTSATWR